MRAKMGSRIRKTYDIAAPAYLAQFRNELDGKPRDRELLNRFAEHTKHCGIVWELGCGPGHVGDYIRQRGVTVHGVDISCESLRQGKACYGDVPYVQSDMLALSAATESLTGILAFYAICHLANDELVAAFREMHRTLRAGGQALVSFHIGEETRHVDEFLGEQADIEFQFFQVDAVVAALREAGFADVEPIEREPYPEVEHPSRRAYLFAVK